MQHVDFLSKLDGQHRAVSFGVITQGDLEYAAPYPFVSVAKLIDVKSAIPEQDR